MLISDITNLLLHNFKVKYFHLFIYLSFICNLTHNKGKESHRHANIDIFSISLFLSIRKFLLYEWYEFSLQKSYRLMYDKTKTLFYSFLFYISYLRFLREILYLVQYVYYNLILQFLEWNIFTLHSFFFMI